MTDFLSALTAIPRGYSSGTYQGEIWGCTLEVSCDEKRWKLYAEQLGGTDFVSCNVYRLASGDQLKPCEMPERKVIEFVIGYRAKS